jgi:carbonic anhydrase
MLIQNPNYFEDQKKGHFPKILWIGIIDLYIQALNMLYFYRFIGCSDARVPANELIGESPGSVFVHRNIANQVVNTDFNAMSVIQYAVDVLQVKHIIVCGHYECGGVKAAMGNDSYGLMDNWLHQIRDTLHFYENELEKLDEHNRFRRLVELNVVEQISHLGNINTVREAWQKGKKPQLHGWVYDIGTGFVKSIVTGVDDLISLKKYCKYEKM